MIDKSKNGNVKVVESMITKLKIRTGILSELNNNKIVERLFLIMAKLPHHDYNSGVYHAWLEEFGIHFFTEAHFDSGTFVSKGIIRVENREQSTGVLQESAVTVLFDNSPGIPVWDAESLSPENVKEMCGALNIRDEHIQEPIFRFSSPNNH